MTTKVNVNNSTGVIDYTGTTVVPAVAPTATGETMYVNSAGTGYISQSVSPTFKNRIINGDMAIDQRNSGAAITATVGALAYACDRWCLWPGGANQTVQRVSVSDLAGFPFGFKITGAANTTFANLDQRIESKCIADAAGKSGAAQVWVYNGTAASRNLSINLYYPTAVDNYTVTTSFANTTVSIPVGWSKQTFVFTFSANVTNGCGLQFLCGSLGATESLIFTGVQLEVGSVATDFELRPQQIELELCQRYYQRNKFTSGSTGFFGSVVTTAAAARTAQVFINYSTPMRSAPTLSSILNLSCRTAGSYATITSLGSYHYGNCGLSLDIVTSTAVAGRGWLLMSNNDANLYIELSAEL